MDDGALGSKTGFQEADWNAHDYMAKKLTYQQWDLDAAAKRAKQTTQTQDIRVWIGDVKQYLADIFPLCLNSLDEADQLWNQLEEAYKTTFRQGFRTNQLDKHALILEVDRLYAQINRLITQSGYFFRFKQRRDRREAVRDYTLKFKPPEGKK